MTDRQSAQANVDRLNLGGKVAHVTEHHAEPRPILPHAPRENATLGPRSPWACFPSPASWRAWWALREVDKESAAIPCDDCLLERAGAERAARRCALPSTLTPGQVPHWARDAVTRFALAAAPERNAGRF